MSDAFDAQRTENYRLNKIKYTPNTGKIGVGFNGATSEPIDIKDLPDDVIAKPPTNIKDMAYYVFSYLAKEGFAKHGETKTQKELEDLMKEKSDAAEVVVEP